MKVNIGSQKVNFTTLATICGGKYIGCDHEFDSMCTDSREATYGSVFCAMKGERVDGHDYIEKAYDMGCRCVIAERIPTNFTPTDMNFVLVDYTVHAMNSFAEDYLQKRNHKKIAITGSVGKTTTKEFVSLVFDESSVYKTKGNYNSTIGLPLSVLEIPKEASVAVLEMGMSDIGEIALMSKTVKPDIAIITNIGSSHLERLGTRENIKKAKLEIVSGMKENGILLVNADDPMLSELDVKVSVMSVGIDNISCDFRAVNIEESGENTSFSILAKGKQIDGFTIPVLGKHNVYAALFAYAAASLSGESDSDIKKRLCRFEKPKMRQNIFDVGGITIIEDCYNASPESMKAALDVEAGLLKQRGVGRSVALLGNMLELGESSRELHRSVGEYAAEKKLQKLVTFGELASEIADASGISDAVRLEDITAHEKAADVLMGILQKGDILLVKASRGVAAEKIIEILKERLK